MKSVSPLFPGHYHLEDQRTALIALIANMPEDATLEDWAGIQAEAKVVIIATVKTVLNINVRNKTRGYSCDPIIINDMLKAS